MGVVAENVLISDFDGTITAVDFYALIDIPKSAPDYLADWRAGRITHFDAMAGFFSHAPTDPQALEAMLRATRPDPGFHASAAALKRAGWDLLVVSAGSSWYIQRIVNGAAKAIHANPGRIEGGRGLVMELPRESPFFSPQLGIDKPAVVRDALARYDRVAYAGDGVVDYEPSLLVDPDLRFAKAGAALARKLESTGHTFRPFEKWSEVVANIAC